MRAYRRIRVVAHTTVAYRPVKPRGETLRDVLCRDRCIREVTGVCEWV